MSDMSIRLYNSDKLLKIVHFELHPLSADFAGLPFSCLKIEPGEILTYNKRILHFNLALNSIERLIVELEKTSIQVNVQAPVQSVKQDNILVEKLQIENERNVTKILYCIVYTRNVTLVSHKL